MMIPLILAPASATIALSEKAAARSPQFALLVESLMKRTFNPTSDCNPVAPGMRANRGLHCDR